MQKSHPFGLAENRFTWVKMYCNGNDLKNHKKLFNIRKDNLEGGIGHYFQKIKLENDKELEVEKNLLKDNLNHKKQKKMKYRFQNLSSQRVINPEKDTEVEKISKKRTYENSKNNLFYNTNGKISSLFKRTPLVVRGQGKKILNNSVDYGRKRGKREKKLIISGNYVKDKLQEIKRKIGFVKGISDYSIPSIILQKVKYNSKKLQLFKKKKKKFLLPYEEINLEVDKIDKLKTRILSESMIINNKKPSFI